MTDVYTKMIALRDHLRDNIVDPIQRKGNWIHYDTLEDGLEKVNVGKTPAIFIERQPSNTFAFESVGTADQEDLMRIQVSIVTRNSDSGMISGKQCNSTELLDKLVQLVDDDIRINSVAITGINYIYPLQLGGNMRAGPNMKVSICIYAMN